jgi:hypothetical protein
MKSAFFISLCQNILMSNTNSAAFKKWFGDSKVVNPDGSPMVVYHGTGTEITRFELKKAGDKEGRAAGVGYGRNKFYLTTAPETANAWADRSTVRGEWAGKKIRGNKYGSGESPQVMAVYVKIENPISGSDYYARLNAKLAKHKKQNQYGKIPQSIRDKAILELDKELKKENIDGIYSENDPQLAAFSPTQIKSATGNRGTFDATNPDIRYAKGGEINNNELIALHGIPESGLAFSDKIGGIAVPSMAIVTKGLEGNLSNYGEVILVAGKEMVEENKVYDGDAYTVRFPRLYEQTDKKQRLKVISEIEDKTEEVRKELYLYGLDDHFEKNKPLGDIIENLKSSQYRRLVYYYAKEKGFAPEIKYKRQPYKLWWFEYSNPDFLESELEEVKDGGWREYGKLGYKLYESFFNKKEVNPSADQERAQLYIKVYGKKNEEYVNENEKMLYPGEADMFEADIKNYFEPKNIVDTNALQDDLDKIYEQNKADIAAYFTNLFKPIYTGRIFFLDGNKNITFALSSVVDYMTTGNIKAKENTPFEGLNKQRGRAAKTMRGVEEIRANSGKIKDGKAYKEENELLSAEFTDKLTDPLSRYYYNKSDFGFNRLDDLSKAVGDIMMGKPAASSLSRRGYYDVPDYLVNEVRDYAKRYKNHSVPYFEFKPQRAVEISEFKMAFIPENAMEETKEILERNGVPYQTYNKETGAAKEFSAHPTLYFAEGGEIKEYAKGGNVRGLESQYGGKLKKLYPQIWVPHQIGKIPNIEKKGEPGYLIDGSFRLGEMVTEVIKPFDLMLPTEKQINNTEQKLIDKYGLGSVINVVLTLVGGNYVLTAFRIKPMPNQKVVEDIQPSELGNSTPIVATKEEFETLENSVKIPKTVRELSELEAEDQSGIVSGLFLSTIENGEVFTIGNKTYTVKRKTKASKTVYQTDKYSGEYEKTSITIEDDKGTKYSYEIWDNWVQNGSRMVPAIKPGKNSNNLSRDIEGVITIDLINENNRFHTNSAVFNKIQNALNSKAGETKKRKTIHPVYKGWDIVKIEDVVKSDLVHRFISDEEDYLGIGSFRVDRITENKDGSITVWGKDQGEWLKLNKGSELIRKPALSFDSAAAFLSKLTEIIDDKTDVNKFAEGGEIDGENFPKFVFKTRKTIVDENGYGVVINDMFSEWDAIKGIVDHAKWAAKAKQVRFGTYGTIGIFDVLKNFPVRTGFNEVIKRSFLNEIEQALEIPVAEQIYRTPFDTKAILADLQKNRYAVIPLTPKLFEQTPVAKQLVKINTRICERWQDLPSTWTFVPDIPKVAYKQEPYNKGLYDIMKPFIAKDEIRPAMMGVQFGQTCIAATNAHVLIAMPKEKDAPQGLFDFSKNAPITDARFPDWTVVIPAENKYRHKVSVNKFRSYLNAVVSGKFSNEGVKSVYLTYGDQDKKEACVNAHILLGIVETFAKLGAENVYLGLNTWKNAVVICADEKAAEKPVSQIGKSVITLLMPLHIEKGDNVVSAAFDIDLDRELFVCYDLRTDDIIDKDGSAVNWVPETKYDNLPYLSVPEIKMLSKTIVKNHTVPICDYVCVKNGVARTTDLDIHFLIKDCNIEDGIYEIIGDALVDVLEDIDHFPNLPDEKFSEIGDFPDFSRLIPAQPFTEKYGNKYRFEWSNGLHIQQINADQPRIEATDRHVLYRFMAEKRFDADIKAVVKQAKKMAELLPMLSGCKLSAARIMDRAGNDDETAEYVRLYNGSYEIYGRCEDVRYPDIKNAVDDLSHRVVFEGIHDLIPKIKKVAQPDIKNLVITPDGNQWQASGRAVVNIYKAVDKVLVVETSLGEISYSKTDGKFDIPNSFVAFMPKIPHANNTVMGICCNSAYLLKVLENSDPQRLELFMKAMEHKVMVAQISDNSISQTSAEKSIQKAGANKAKTGMEYEKHMQFLNLLLGEAQAFKFGGEIMAQVPHNYGMAENVDVPGLGVVSQMLALQDIAMHYGIPFYVVKNQYKKGLQIELRQTTDRVFAGAAVRTNLMEDIGYYDGMAAIDESGAETPVIDLEIDPEEYLINTGDYLADYIENENETNIKKLLTCESCVQEFDTYLAGEIGHIEKSTAEIARLKWVKAAQGLRKMAKGGLAYGNSHANGGIPLTVKSTGQRIEIEGGEGVVNKHTMKKSNTYEYNGRKMTPCEIISDLNQKGGGVRFKCADVQA